MNNATNPPVGQVTWDTVFPYLRRQLTPVMFQAASVGGATTFSRNRLPIHWVSEITADLLTSKFLSEWCNQTSDEEVRYGA